MTVPLSCTGSTLNDPLVKRLRRGAHQLDEAMAPFVIPQFDVPLLINPAVHLNKPFVLLAPTSQYPPGRKQHEKSLDVHRRRVDSLRIAAGTAAASCLIALGSLNSNFITRAAAAPAFSHRGLIVTSSTRTVEATTPPISTTVVGLVRSTNRDSAQTTSATPTSSAQTVTGSTLQPKN